MTDSEALLPCPFCGGRAERVDIHEGENAGGSCVCCTRCQASGNLEFGRKENFVSNWNCRAALSRPSSPAASDGDEYFLTAHVSADGRIIGIDHPNDADFDAVLTAHVALRDRINERIATQSRCPFYPKGRPPAASDGDLEDEVAVFLRAYGDAFVREVLKQAAPVSDGGAVREALDKLREIASEDAHGRYGRLAREALAALDRLNQPSPPPTGSEREKVIEECAKVADAAMLVGDGCADPRTWDNGYNNACHNIAKRIRALTPTGSEQL